jgi:hypothetical protein
MSGMPISLSASGGAGSAVQDEALMQRLKELEKLQQQSWDDREKLSKQLEMERANNVVRTKPAPSVRVCTHRPLPVAQSPQKAHL